MKPTRAPHRRLILSLSLVALLIGASAARGMVFSPPEILSGTVQGSAPEVATDGKGTWIAAWQSPFDPLFGGTGTEGDILFVRSEDGGMSWSKTPEQLNSYAATDQAFDRAPQLATDGNGTWLAAWTSTYGPGGVTTSGTVAHVVVSWSMDGGVVWTPAKALTSLGVVSDVTTDANGTWVVGILRSGVEVRVARTTDKGDTWSEQWLNPSQCVPTCVLESSGPRIATDRDGLWVTVWGSRDKNWQFGVGSGTEEWDTFFSRSLNGGVDWEGTRTLKDGLDTVRDAYSDATPDVATDGNGNWVVVFTAYGPGTDIGGEGDILVKRSTNGGVSWTYQTLLNTNAANDTARDVAPRVVVDGTGTWLAAWNTNASGNDGDFAMARSTDGGVTWNAPAPLNTNATTDTRGDGHSPLGLATDGTGTWVAVWDSINYQPFTLDIMVARGLSPRVLSIKTQGPNPTAAVEVTFDVTFSVSVTGVDATDFALNTTIGDAQIKNVAVGDDGLIVVTVSTGTTNGTIRLDVVDDDSIRDASGDRLRGSDTLDGSFSTGESYDVDHQALKFGQDIVAFESGRSNPSFSFDDVDWMNTELNNGPTCTSSQCPDSHAVRIDALRQLLAGDIGDFSIKWQFNNGRNSFSAAYSTSDDPVRDPMLLYHTDQSRNANFDHSGPLVNLTPVGGLTIYYNSAIPRQSADIACGTVSDPTLRTDNYVCLDNVNNTKNLHARDQEGLVLLEYDDQNSNPLGVEIVRVKRDLPESPAIAVNIGSRLHPFKDPCGDPKHQPEAPCPSGQLQKRRAIPRNPNNPYTYQHLAATSPQKGEVWAIRKNDFRSDIDVTWMRPSSTAKAAGIQMAVEWPLERRQYTAQWPDGEPGKYQVYVRGEAATPGAKVAIPPALNATKACDTSCEEYPNGGHADLTNGLFSSPGPGWTLLKYATPDGQGTGWVGFEVVRSIIHGDTTLFNLRPPDLRDSALTR